MGKIILNTDEMKKALRSAVSAMDTKNVIPVLNCVSLLFEENKLKLRSTNLDRTFQQVFAIQSELSEEINIDGRKFLQAIETVASEFFEVSIDEKNLTIHKAQGKISLRRDTSDFADIQSIAGDYLDPEQWIKIKTNDFICAMTANVFGTREDKVLTNDFRNAIQFTVSTNLIESSFTSISTNKQIFAQTLGLCERSNEVDDKEPLVYQFPIGSMGYILSVLKKYAHQHETVKIHQDKHHLFLLLGKDILLFVRKLTVNFPEMTTFLNSLQFTNFVTVESGELLNAFDSAVLTSDDRALAMNFDLTEGQLVLNCIGAEIGESTQEIWGKTDLTREIYTSYNHTYLAPVLRLVQKQTLDEDVEQGSNPIKLSFSVQKAKDPNNLRYVYSFPLEVSAKMENVTVKFLLGSMARDHETNFEAIEEAKTEVSYANAV